jgi:hypothetical protein
VKVSDPRFEIANVSPAGVVTLRMADIPDKLIGQQNIVLSYDGHPSLPIKITPRQSKPKIQATKQVVLQGNDVHSEGLVNIVVTSPQAAEIREVKINGAAAELYSLHRTVSYGSYALGFKAADRIDEASKVKSVKLDVYFKGSAAPVSVTVKVAVK